MVKVGDLSADKSLENRSADHFAVFTFKFALPIYPLKNRVCPTCDILVPVFFVVYISCGVQPDKHSIRLSKQKYEDFAYIVNKPTTIRNVGSAVAHW